MNKLTVIVICLLPVFTFAADITVDDDGIADFTKIQDAIDNAQDGQVIIVQPGLYNESISFKASAVILTGSDPNDPNTVSQTIITSTSGYTVIFDANETNTSVLTGFTITNSGILCDGTSPVISKNIIQNCYNEGIFGTSNASPVVTENIIINNNRQGIAHCNGLISDNIISENRSGILNCDGLITGNIITLNRENIIGFGGGLSFCDGQISDNIIADNHSAYRGGGLYDCDAVISNNYITGNYSYNAGGGLCFCNGTIKNNIISGNSSINGGGLFGCFSYTFNNTIVGNSASEGGGINQFGYFFNNIVAFNRAQIGAGLSGAGLNSYNLFWNYANNFGNGAIAGIGDIIAEPGFLENGYWDSGTQTSQNDDFWVDGDYHLKSQFGRWDSNDLIWVLDDTSSIAIDAGDPNSDYTNELWPHGKLANLGVYGNTAQASMSASSAGNVADLNHDDWIDEEDLAMLNDKWYSTELLLAEDLNRNGIVDENDLAILEDNWLPRPPPPEPPTPNPMTWAVAPNAISAYAISMVAETAASSDDSSIEYYFQNNTMSGHDSGWQSSPAYTDSNLNPGTTYSYQVKARNTANLLETEFSESLSATTNTVDITAPVPNPAQWQTQPYRLSSTSIRMVAVTAADENGVEYYFQCTSHPQYSSSWQDSPEYTATALPKGTYRFVVRARDKSINQNTTANSIEVAVDLQPPSPNPMRWAEDGEPSEVYMGTGMLGYWAEMTAATATDVSEPVEYYFDCTTQSGFSSGWQSSPYYTVQIGRAGQLQRFRVKARDAAGNETSYSSTLPAY